MSDLTDCVELNNKLNTILKSLEHQGVYKVEGMEFAKASAIIEDNRLKMQSMYNDKLRKLQNLLDNKFGRRKSRRRRV